MIIFVEILVSDTLFFRNLERWGLRAAGGGGDESMPLNPVSTGNQPPKRRSGALAVGAGIFLSRIMGLVRERVFAHYLGSSDAAGAFRAALKIPNLLQNLFGEGALSASLIPVYAKLLAEGRAEEAARVAGTVFTFLLMLVTGIAVAGVLGAEVIVGLLVPGFTGAVRDHTVILIRIMFPGMAFLVLSAWCLGVLNSHRHFFLSYVAPVIWNSAIIIALVAFGTGLVLDNVGQMDLAAKAAWGVTVGSVLQFLVQVPAVLRLNRGVMMAWAWRRSGGESPVRQVLVNAGPAVLARGVVQISAFIDQVLSSFLGAQMVAVMAYAQTVYLLPVSLFGMSISAAELPELSSRSAGANAGSEAALLAIRARLKKALDRLSFFIVPSVIGMVVVGDAIARTLFVTGNFTAQDTLLVWPVMGVMALGLFATTRARLFTSAFWALGDTKTPAVIAVVRVAVSASVGLVVIFFLKDDLQLTNGQAAAALAGATVCAAWVEIFLVWRILSRRIGAMSLTTARDLRIWLIAIVAGFAARAVGMIPIDHPLVSGALTLAVFGLLYLAGARLAGLAEVAELVKKISRARGR